MNRFNILIATMLLLFFLTILNIFFYSFITISLYKLICYESNSLSTIISSVITHKICNIFYVLQHNLTYIIVGINWYSVIYCEYLYLNNNIFFLDVLLNNTINSYIYFFDQYSLETQQNN